MPAWGRVRVCFQDLDTQWGSVSNSSDVVLAEMVYPADAAQSEAAALTRRPTWEQAEGSPLPLGVTWIEQEQAFNFAVHAEHAESVTLLLYSSADLVNPLLTFRSAPSRCRQKFHESTKEYREKRNKRLRENYKRLKEKERKQLAIVAMEKRHGKKR